MRYSKEDYKAIALLPYEILRASARGIGRVVVEHVERFVGIEPDLSPDEWRRFNEESHAETPLEILAEHEEEVTAWANAVFIYMGMNLPEGIDRGEVIDKCIEMLEHDTL